MDLGVFDFIGLGFVIIEFGELDIFFVVVWVGGEFWEVLGCNVRWCGSWLYGLGGFLLFLVGFLGVGIEVVVLLYDLMSVNGWNM